METTTTELCHYCDEPLEIDLLDVWGRDFMFSTCCEQQHVDLLFELETSPRSPIIRDLFQGYGIPCRQIASDAWGGTYQIDHGLTVEPVDLTTAKAFIAEHHRHHKPSLSWRFGFSVFNGPDLVGVCMVGRPVARMIDPTTTVEVTRLCIRDDLPAGLVWNGCSMLYAAAAREAKRRGFARIITYLLETESGTSVEAAGWKREARTKGGSWNRPSRGRTDSAPTCRKWRYARELRRAA